MLGLSTIDEARDCWSLLADCSLPVAPDRLEVELTLSWCDARSTLTCWSCFSLVARLARGRRPRRARLRRTTRQGTSDSVALRSTTNASTWHVNCRSFWSSMQGSCRDCHPVGPSAIGNSPSPMTPELTPTISVVSGHWPASEHIRPLTGPRCPTLNYDVAVGTKSRVCTIRTSKSPSATSTARVAPLSAWNSKWRSETTRSFIGDFR